VAKKHKGRDWGATITALKKDNDLRGTERSVARLTGAKGRKGFILGKEKHNQKAHTGENVCQSRRKKRGRKKDPSKKPDKGDFQGGKKGGQDHKFGRVVKKGGNYHLVDGGENKGQGEAVWERGEGACRQTKQRRAVGRTSKEYRPEENRRGASRHCSKGGVGW